MTTPKVDPTKAHTIFVISNDGSFSSEAVNYPTINNKCQGRQATGPIEKGLADAGLIPEIKEPAREYHQSQQQQQQQRLRQ